MRLIALCGAAGAGKDTVADMLPARKLAFADTLYREVAEAFGVTVEWLQRRKFKERPVAELAVVRSADIGLIDSLPPSVDWSAPRSPRQILQWWGDYRRAQDPDYFVNEMDAHIQRSAEWDGADVVITDVRFKNEADFVRALGGQIWQIKRPGYEAGGTGHASDTAGDEFGPDRVVVNGGSVEDLRAVVLSAWEGAR